MNLISDKEVGSYQFPKRVIFADGYICLKAAGILPEKAGRTEREEKETMVLRLFPAQEISKFWILFNAIRSQTIVKKQKIVCNSTEALKQQFKRKGQYQSENI